MRSIFVFTFELVWKAIPNFLYFITQHTDNYLLQSSRYFDYCQMLFLVDKDPH